VTSLSTIVGLNVSSTIATHSRMANCDFNPGHGLSRHVFGGRSPSNHVTPSSPQGRLSSNNEDELSALYGRCSNRTGSEWVTLSKSLLLQLVESICQLSFQTEVASNSTRSEPVRHYNIEPEIERRRSVDCVVSVMECNKEIAQIAVGTDSSETVVPPGECCGTIPPPCDVQSNQLTSVAEPLDDDQTKAVELMVSAPVDTPILSLTAGNSLPSPVRIGLRSRMDSTGLDEAPTCDVEIRSGADGIPDNCVSHMSPRIIVVPVDDVTKCDVGNDESVATSPAVSPTKCTMRRQATSRRTSDDTSRFNELAQRRRYLRAHRRHSGNADAKSQPFADMSRDVIVNCRSVNDDRTPPMFLHPVRGQSRRVRSSQQPWVALNKSVVYRMLDVVLSQSAPVLPRGSDSSTMSGTVKRSAKTRIWNPAISSAPSSPDYTVDDSDSHVIADQSANSQTVKAVDGENSGNRKSVDFKRPMELHTMTSSLQLDSGPSLLRNLLDGAEDFAVNSRRHSETGPMTSPTYGSCGPVAPNVHAFPLSYRRRHHSAGRTPDDWLAMTSFNGRLATDTQGFHSSLMFVDTEHGRDIYNYFRSPDGRPVIASASSLSSSSLCSNASVAALDYTVQTLQSHEADDRKTQSSLPELSRTAHGVAPRWVAFNKGDVSTLFESLATAMMAAEAPAGVGKAETSTMDDDDDDVWSDSPSSGVASCSAATRRTRSRVVLSADSVFRRPLAANEPVKWKSNLMRRMRDEVQSKRAGKEGGSVT